MVLLKLETTKSKQFGLINKACIKCISVRLEVNNTNKQGVFSRQIRQFKLNIKLNWVKRHRCNFVSIAVCYLLMLFLNQHQRVNYKVNRKCDHSK